jgi:putative component of toxin-antitoxin plasmid stabilization module
MYMMNGYKPTNANCNQTLNDSKIQHSKIKHRMKKIRTKRMGDMTPQNRGKKGPK